MTWLFDTNVVSALRRRQNNPAVYDWAASIEPMSIFVSSVSIMEIEKGVLRMERTDPRQGARLRSWFDRAVLGAFERRILPFDLATAHRCAALHVPNPRPAYDSMIAATALVHGLTVVTRNVKDFAPLGVKVLNPWAV